MDERSVYICRYTRVIYCRYSIRTVGNIVVRNPSEIPETVLVEVVHVFSTLPLSPQPVQSKRKRTVFVRILRRYWYL